MTSTSIDRQQLADDVDALRAQIAALPRSEPFERAIYHAGRLAIAIRSSHSEATRFAAFTVLKVIRDHAAELTPDITARAQAIRTALESTGLDLSK